MRFLQTEQLQIALGGRTLLDRLDWTVRRGEFWCVLGKNGVGKSSLLYALSGLLPHAAGRLLLAGEPIASPHCSHAGKAAWSDAAESG